MTDNEIKKALECCISREPCYKTKCPFKIKQICGDDIKALEKSALDLINRLQAENKRLKKVEANILKVMGENIEQTKAEAYKEFAEKLHGELRMYGAKDKFNKSVFLNVVDKAKKELVGEDK